MSSRYDAVVIGSGPNGLTAAAYLAAAGQRVALVERNVETGGGLTTQELSGFRLNHHATFMLMGELLPPYRDLGLADRGVRFLHPEIPVAFLFGDRKALVLSSDLARTEASAEALSPGDGARLRRMLEEFDAMCEAFLLPATYAPPLPPLEQTVALEGADAMGARIAEISELSPLELVQSYELRDPRLAAAVLYLATLFGLEAEEGGIGFLAPIYVSRLLRASLVAGGSHQLASALRRTVEEHGGEVWTAARVRAIRLEDGRATGVRLADGRELEAPVVLSTLDPVQTFLELLPEKALDPELRSSFEQWEWERTSLFVFHAGIVGEPPRYEGYPEEVDRALLVVMGYERPEDVIEHQRELAAGDRSRIAGHGSVPSLFDPLLVPQHVPFGPHHVVRWECWAPYEGDWSPPARDEFAERCFEAWCRYAPNLREANARVRIAWSPRDIEGHLPTMRRGSIKHGAYTSLQMGYNRPVPECSGYRTPVPGLYVGGASVHPGGMVTMGPGYNAARAVAADLGLPLWEEPEMLRAARARGYLTSDAPAEEGT